MEEGRWKSFCHAGGFYSLTDDADEADDADCF